MSTLIPKERRAELDALLERLNQELDNDAPT